MRSVVFLVLLAAAPAVWCQTTGEDPRSPIEVIDKCSDAADEDSIGLEALEEDCPGLTRALEESGYLALLATASRDALDVDDLFDLLQVDYWYDEDAPRDVDVGTLGPILDSLRTQEPERPLTWFERFKRWLRSMLERRSSSSSGSDNWLSRWLDDLDVPDAIARGILLTSIGLLVLLTIVVVVNELRAAGVFRRRRSSQDVDAILAGLAPATADDVADIDTLPPERKIPMLLRMLVTTLVQSGRLRTERSLTHRELCTRATFDDVQQRESFRRVASLAERTVYGVGEVPAEEVEPIVAAARALDAQLRGASA